MFIAFHTKDLYGENAAIFDMANGDYYGPHNHITVGFQYASFWFADNSPSISYVQDMLQRLHIKYTMTASDQ